MLFFLFAYHYQVLRDYVCVHELKNLLMTLTKSIVSRSVPAVFSPHIEKVLQERGTLFPSSKQLQLQYTAHCKEKA
jgi:hypothetical protein